MLCETFSYFCRQIVKQGHVGGTCRNKKHIRNAREFSHSGEPGKGYILSGCYVTIRRMLQLVGKAAKLKYRSICLPLGLARLAAPYYERRSLRERKPLFFTPYSVSVLASNGQFSHAAASERFAYQPRPIEETLGDMTAWLLNQK